MHSFCPRARRQWYPQGRAQSEDVSSLRRGPEIRGRAGGSHLSLGRQGSACAEVGTRCTVFVPTLDDIGIPKGVPKAKTFLR